MVETINTPKRTRLCDWAIYCLTVWAITNSVVLAERYSYRAAALFSHAGSAIFTVALLGSLVSILGGFALAAVAVINEPRRARARGTFALAAAVFGQFVYFILTGKVD
jgi:hypothetical protein